MCPAAAYKVSSEYSMLRAAGINGWLDEQSTGMEVLVAIKRAGADIILTYLVTQAVRSTFRSSIGMMMPGPVLCVSLPSASMERGHLAQNAGQPEGG